MYVHDMVLDILRQEGKVVISMYLVVVDPIISTNEEGYKN